MMWITHSGGRRIDAILLTPAFCNVNSPVATRFHEFLHARDHKGFLYTYLQCSSWGMIAQVESGLFWYD